MYEYSAQPAASAVMPISAYPIALKSPLIVAAAPAVPLLCWRIAAAAARRVLQGGIPRAPIGPLFILDGPARGAVRFLKEGAIEARRYQQDMAEQAASENCMVVLPTGLGKTAVALLVMDKMLQKGGVLFLAPTRVLAGQHHEFLSSRLAISDVALVTGEDSEKRRAQAWPSSVVCATPEITRNDMERGMFDPGQLSLAVFDEAHRTVGDYAYSSIAGMLPRSVRIVGMTATLPSEIQKATKIMTTLRIASVAQRRDDSPDVAPYVHKTDTEIIKVRLPPDMAEAQASIKRALDSMYVRMKEAGVMPDRSLSALVKIRAQVLAERKSAIKPLFAAIRIHQALALFEAHGATAFLKYCERARQKGARDLFEDPDFSHAVAVADRIRRGGLEHPKIAKLVGILSGLEGRALVFSSFRDSVDVIREKLGEAGIESGMLIGKAGESGLKQAKQVEAVRRFRDGEYPVMVATRVGEEGLDISEVNLVVFYDNTPSAIRYVQRRGRTGRKDSGRMVVLMAEGTIDEAYHWIGYRRVASSKGMGERVARGIQETL